MMITTILCIAHNAKHQVAEYPVLGHCTFFIGVAIGWMRMSHTQCTHVHMYLLPWTDCTTASESVQSDVGPSI